MKELYVVTDFEGEVLGTQLAGSAGRAIDLFAKRNHLMASHLSAVSLMDWQPLIVAGTDYPATALNSS